MQLPSLSDTLCNKQMSLATLWHMPHFNKLTALIIDKFKAMIKTNNNNKHNNNKGDTAKIAANVGKCKNNNY